MLKASTQIQRSRDGQKQREEVTRQDSILGMHTRDTIGEFEPVYPFFFIVQTRPTLQLINQALFEVLLAQDMKLAFPLEVKKK